MPECSWNALSCCFARKYLNILLTCLMFCAVCTWLLESIYRLKQRHGSCEYQERVCCFIFWIWLVIVLLYNDWKKWLKIGFSGNAFICFQCGDVTCKNVYGTTHLICCRCVYIIPPHLWWDRGRTVFKVLCYKLEGRWFDPSWCHWNFSLT